MPEAYARPPISEALIEFRYAGSADDTAVPRARKRLSPNFPKADELREFQVTIGPDGLAQTTQLGAPYVKMTSADGSKIVQLRPSGVVLSHLPPYPGWDSFVAEFRAVLKCASAIAKKRPLSRIGVRFLNRIDAPARVDEGIDPGDYIRAGISDLPFDHGPFGTMLSQLATVLDEGRFGLVLNCGLAQSPLIDHKAVVLDIEVFNQDNLPVTQEGIWQQVDEMRAWKNRVFESSITDKARELFR